MESRHSLILAALAASSIAFASCATVPGRNAGNRGSGEMSPGDIAILPLDITSYLIKAESGFIMVDTGYSMKHGDHSALDRELAERGCLPGDLILVILTHGDQDHTDAAAHLREIYGAKIAMHAGDAPMAESGDITIGRKVKPDHFSFLGKAIRAFAPKGRPYATFTPDILLEDGQSLSEYGLDATVLSLPGHSKGSIGILLAGGELFCGDLLFSYFGPDYHFYLDDAAAARASVATLRSLQVTTVYPGHGKPFPLSKFRK